MSEIVISSRVGVCQPIGFKFGFSAGLIGLVLFQVGGAEFDAAQWESMAAQCDKCNQSEFC